MEPTRIGINGFGRIGQLVFRAALNEPSLKVVAINDLIDIEYIMYLMKFDSTHGSLDASISIEDNAILVNGERIRITSERNPENLNWTEVDAKFIVEATGVFLSSELTSSHLHAGASAVVMTAPAKDDTPTFVMGVNHQEYDPQMRIVSNASCTTNCLAPIAKVLHDNFGIKSGLMTTVHATTSSQNTVDGISKKNWRIGRSAGQNIIPSSTGAAKAVGKVIPALNGKLTGMAFRVPTPNVSVVDLAVNLNTAVDVTTVNKAMKGASENDLKGILGYIDEQVVSTDFLGDPKSSIYDASSTILLNKNFIKVIAWYDNEWGYSNRLLDLIKYMESVV